MRRYFSVLISLFMMSLLFSHSVFAEEKQTQTELSDDSKSAVLIERDTGTILYEKNIHEKLPPAR